MSSATILKPNLIARLGPALGLDGSRADQRGQQRYVRVGLTVASTVLNRGLSTLTLLISVPLTVRYLGVERYGVWLALSSLIAIMAHVDLGLSSGLVNAISAADGSKDRSAAARSVTISPADFGAVFASGWPSTEPSFSSGFGMEFEDGAGNLVFVNFVRSPGQRTGGAILAIHSCNQLVGKVGCVVDLSAAYRLKDASLYPQWYGFTHDQPELLAQSVYGLPELHRDDLKGAALVATPGCHVTAATLALAPLVRAGLLATTGVVVNSITGVSRPGAEAHEHVLHGRRGRHRVRPARSSAHTGDRA